MFTVGTAPNSVQRQNFVTINDDDVFEPDETFRVTFEAVDTSQGDSPNFVVGSISETIITILDEDDCKLILLYAVKRGCMK